MVEVAVMALAGYRKAQFLVVCALVNLASNLSLNLILVAAGTHWRSALLPVLELAVVPAEWAVLRLVVAGPEPPPPVRSAGSGRLLLVTLLANAASFGLGLVVF